MGGVGFEFELALLGDELAKLALGFVEAVEPDGFPGQSMGLERAEVNGPCGGETMSVGPGATLDFGDERVIDLQVAIGAHIMGAEVMSGAGGQKGAGSMRLPAFVFSTRRRVKCLTGRPQFSRRCRRRRRWSCPRLRGSAIARQ